LKIKVLILDENYYQFLFTDAGIINFDFFSQSVNLNTKRFATNITYYAFSV